MNHKTYCNEINKGNALEKTLCPITPERLWELYWKEGKSADQIAEYLTHATQRSKSFCGGSVREWLKKAGITLRTGSELVTHTQLRNPELLHSRIERIKKARTHFVKNPYHELTAKEQKAIVRRLTASRKPFNDLQKSKRIKKKCEWSDCSNMLEVTESRLKKCNHHFCGRSCAMKFAHKERRLNKLRTVKPNTEADQQTKEWAERILGRKVD
jgi:hypothetical protein